MLNFIKYSVVLILQLWELYASQGSNFVVVVWMGFLVFLFFFFCLDSIWLKKYFTFPSVCSSTWPACHTRLAANGFYGQMGTAFSERGIPMSLGFVQSVFIDSLFEQSYWSFP